LANPSALILASVMMLIYVGQNECATTIHNGWLKTIEDGVHTYDIFKEGVSKKKVGTQEFADAVVSRLGQKPEQLKAVSYQKKSSGTTTVFQRKTIKTKRQLVGVDVYFYSSASAEAFQKSILDKKFGDFQLEMISNRGARIYPGGMPETFCVDQWRVRFRPNQEECTQETIVDLLSTLTKEKFDIIKTEHLYDFDGEPGYSSPKG
nr:Isocitrate dehydrogenase [NADP] [Chlamydiota bacterium]